MEIQSGWFSFDLEILENQSCWFCFEPGYTGKPLFLIQFWTWKYLKTSHFDNLWSMTGGRADGRTGGRVGWLKSIGKESILGICILKNTNMQYIIEGWRWDMFQKRRAPKNDEIWRRFRGEISHMRSIQARKLKLLKWSFPGDADGDDGDSAPTTLPSGKSPSP